MENGFMPNKELAEQLHKPIIRKFEKRKVQSSLRSGTTSEITPFSREYFFTPLWRTIKNSSRAGSGREDRADREKDKSNYTQFPPFPSKVRRDKWLAQIFRKDLTDRILEKTRIKTMLSASPSSVFSHKVHNIRFEKQIRILS